MQITNMVRCNNCMTVYVEDQEQCDKCHTDAYFMQPFNDGEGLKVKQGYTADMKWTVNERQNCYEVLADGFITLAKTNSKTAEDKANAALIAAAPELLDALKAVVGDLVNGHDIQPTTNGLIHRAIAKAEGRS